jgi:hypothetical protein
MPPQATQGTQTVPDPPAGDGNTGDPNADVSPVRNPSLGHWQGIATYLNGGGTPAANQALEQHHQQVMADAIRHSRTAKMYYSSTLSRREPVTGAVNDPATGKPWTDEDIAKWRQMGDAAWADYNKVVGKSKQAKPILAKMGEVIKHVFKGGQQAQQQGQPAAIAGSPQGGPQAAPPGTPGTPIKGATPDAPWTGPVPYPKGQWSNPPQPGDAGGAGAGAPATQGSPTVPPPPQAAASPKPTVPPPPGAGGMNPLQESAMLEANQAMTKEQDELRQKTALAGGEARARTAGTIEGEGEGLSSLGVSAEDIRKAAVAHYGGAGLRATKKLRPIWIDNPDGSPTKIPAWQSETPDENGGYPVFGPSGMVVDNPTALQPARLPTQSSTTSAYNADTGTTTTSHTSQKVAPSSARSGSGRTSSSGRGRVALPPGSAGEGRIATMAHAWATSGIEPSAKDKPFVEKYMDEHQMQPVQKPTAVERKLNDDIKKVEPMVDKLESFLQDNKLTEEGKGGLFSPSAWRERSKVQKAWEEYSHGLPPKDKQLGQLIKYAAAIKIMGAAPWMSIGRGRYIYSEVVQHLPEPTDTPAQLYEKVQFFRTILDDARGSLPSSLTGGGGGETSAPTNPYR